MAHAKASIGTTDYAVSITAGHHQLGADEGAELGGMMYRNSGVGQAHSVVRRMPLAVDSNVGL